MERIFTFLNVSLHYMLSSVDSANNQANEGIEN